MSKILNSVLEKVSENNNEYRTFLRDLNVKIDEKTTAFVGDVVTASGYTVDFSNAITLAKEKIVNPVSRTVESYVIKDLRSVETVNEQFVEKINDKIENTSINSKEEKEAFNNNLNQLLNEKYLEIVKIKRVDFLNNDEKNDDIESCVKDFYDSINANNTTSNLEDTFNAFKKELYNVITNTLTKISDLYLNNFVGEVSSALNSSVDYNDKFEESAEEFKPFIPDINPVPEVLIPSIPEVEVNSPIEPELNDVKIDDELIVPDIEEESNEINNEPLVENEIITPVINDEKQEDSTLMNVEPISPIEFTEEQVNETSKEAFKKPYDVEEILKIAKSPIVAVPEVKETIEKDDYVKVEPIINEKETDTMEAEYSERDIVEEMIRRLTKRLEEIDERRESYKEEKTKLEEDEAFVNDLIESSNAKREDLDKFEQELNDKEEELNNKQKELEKKINDVMPFANAVLNSEKES